MVLTYSGRAPREGIKSITKFSLDFFLSIAYVSSSARTPGEHHVHGLMQFDGWGDGFGDGVRGG
jgi:hypothetical protein